MSFHLKEWYFGETRGSARSCHRLLGQEWCHCQRDPTAPLRSDVLGGFQNNAHHRIATFN